MPVQVEEAMPNMMNAIQTAEFNAKGFACARDLFAPDLRKMS